MISSTLALQSIRYSKEEEGSGQDGGLIKDKREVPSVHTSARLEGGGGEGGDLQNLKIHLGAFASSRPSPDKVKERNRSKQGRIHDNNSRKLKNKFRRVV